ncbi:flagellar biosynthesis protein FlgE [Pseudomonas sp. Leaf127]|uniref:flagellar hook-basal body complex protein n=1 Tax=Pseudomonas sp. Leaf127 TaxID=1736267 RepID=UPI0007035AB4|nr:flagellar hook-basal body complex protein [Pseudomonas sp. Leaf127]KQQ57101.1 flagellar biosynthesis protein FlgE [Pseudomonas sp. Leaf127]
MTFNVAMSGLRAAHKRLEVAGNNIANVGTVGFKSSRAEFAALYSAAQLGGGQNAAGDGVRLANIAQNFSSGVAMSSAGAPLDMRIQGNGFFVVSEQGSLAYTRAGAFHKDAEDFIVDSDGNRLQGYGVDAQGAIINGVRSDLKIDTSVMQPAASRELKQAVNLGAGMPSLATLRPFDAGDPNTYTRVVTRTIQDQGVAAVPELVDAGGVVIRPGSPAVPPADHEFKQYFVKTDADRWEVYVTVDGRNPLDPTASTPLQWAVRRHSDGSVVLAGGNQQVSKVSDTEFALSGWKPARQVNGQWTASPAGNGGKVALPLLDGGLSLIDEADPLMARPLPAFRPSDVGAYSKMFSSAIHDSLGNVHDLRQYFVKDGTNSWKLHVLVNDRNPVDPQSSEPMTASLLFDSSGQLSSVTGSPGLELDGDALVVHGWLPAWQPRRGEALWAPNGATAHPDGLRIQIDRLTQHNADTARSSVHVDGHAPGALSGISVGRDGVLQASFSNGLYRPIGQVMLARFSNEQGLIPQSETRWRQTHASGIADYQTPGQGGVGSLVANSLEASNVDLTAELVELVQAQTAFQGNSKVISTETNLLQTLIQST